MVRRPYTLDPAANADILGLDMRAPGAAEWKRYATIPASASGTISALLYPYPVLDVAEGDWQFRVTAFRYTTDPVAWVDGTTRLVYEAGFWASAPHFGEVPVGVMSGPVRLRIENTVGGPLRIKSVSAPAGSELAVTDDGCAGTTLTLVQGCYVGVTFTPTAAGLRRGTLLVDANSPQKEVYMVGTGVPTTVDPVEQPGPAPTPSPSPAPLMQDPG